ncbi:hypothetical protein M413DRAFT_404458 [Hebeloma cylindrosporum]|uniref:Nephrocystin 3-like N-terminal domain-containing protein n=1 Tax=Hebeloma cylindrosporum TaxID=76867 RepID=A0A0C2Y0Z1_HEBCY|nr:hypothetical protein M413DRAFT_404458 [Hebeloma cylindrosporum h7]
MYLVSVSFTFVIHLVAEMSMLSGSYRPSIHGGTFNVFAANQITTPTGFERLVQAVSPNAFYNSDDRPDPPKCHENTRVAVINKIIDWATGRIEKDAFMLWLYGSAGAGKTAIARKVAELFAEDGLLLAGFLFFRSDSRRNTMTPLVANIAYCVTCVIPDARGTIGRVLEADPTSGLSDSSTTLSAELGSLTSLPGPSRSHLSPYQHHFFCLVELNASERKSMHIWRR